MPCGNDWMYECDECGGYEYDEIHTNNNIAGYHTYVEKDMSYSYEYDEDYYDEA